MYLTQPPASVVYTSLTRTRSGFPSYAYRRSGLRACDLLVAATAQADDMKAWVAFQPRRIVDGEHFDVERAFRTEIDDWLGQGEEQTTVFDFTESEEDV